MADVISFRKRFLHTLLPLESRRTIAMLTGARQTGKTTLAKLQYPKLPYLNLDSMEIREKMQQIPTAAWAASIGKAVIDEAQKEPAIFEKIKYAYDAREIDFSVLLGSSQITLLKSIRESLAGRVSIYELYPLMMAEIYTTPDRELLPPLVDRILHGELISKVLASVPAVLLDKEEMNRVNAQTYLLQWGGMPELLTLSNDDKQRWIKDYEYTYLERDLSDLVRLNDLQPFRTFQKLAALRTGCLLNYSELARDSAVSVDTARRYLEYLRLSYQVILLQPYFRNLTSAVIKTPKIYWLDIGILRYLTGLTSGLTGELFETMVVSELFKYIKTMQHNVELFFYRTRAGLEVDLIIQFPQGIIGIEIKSRSSISTKDMTALKEISAQAKNQWLGGLVIYNGTEIKKIGDPHIWAVPGWRLFL
ncbi:MAG: hypothetical protein A3E83_09095 [Gammaproteobacteria bacterium RIFCSPHIGHO2_12_FULL_41_20]|nr:MAG: hypothetical protein A3E83_09095 [Gammaproteobacteria bacterium RIFCSPHIGHO2_12_FULL_41_20]